MQTATKNKAGKNRGSALAASTLTTAIEWYDYYLYGLMSGLVFSKVFFSSSSGSAGVIEAFGIFAAGFVTRPIGAALFGHFGDRIGRKKTLTWSTICMGLPTVAVAFTPTYDTIGIAGAIILTLLRLLQGIGLGGQWAGAVLVSMEAGGQARRGFFASFAQVGSPLGLLLGSAAVSLTTHFTTEDAFYSWAWRIPFVISGVLIAVTFFIRLRVSETPEFDDIKSKQQTVANPVGEVLRHHWRAVILAALVRTSEMAPFYVFTAFVVTYGTDHVGYSSNFVLNAVLIASLFSLVWILLFGHLSDRFGRRRTYVFGAAATAIYALVYYPMLDSKVHWLAIIAIVLSLIPHDIQYGPQAAFIAESFPANVRYTGASLGSQFASIISGGPAPLIAAALLTIFDSSGALIIYIFVCCAIGAGAALKLQTSTASSAKPVSADIASSPEPARETGA